MPEAADGRRREPPAWPLARHGPGDLPLRHNVVTPQLFAVPPEGTIGWHTRQGVPGYLGVREMARRFSLYPRTWKRSAPDANIDHRRVPNLRVFFSRKGESLAVTKDAKDYLPGDLVTWSLPGNLPHIGLVVDSKGQSGRNQIVHDVGRGPKLEDVLFEWEITGHYRYAGPRR